MIQEMDKAPKEPEPGIDIDPADASPAQKGLASRTIQSRTFQRIHQQARRSLESSASSNPTSPLLSPNTSMEGRLVYSPALTSPFRISWNIQHTHKKKANLFPGFLMCRVDLCYTR